MDDELEENTAYNYGTSIVASIERTMFDLGIFKEKKNLWNGCPASIMNPTDVGEYCVRTYYDYYMEELFTEISFLKYSFKNYNERLYSSCKRAKILNKTETWTNKDEETFRRASNTCVMKYNSCLRLFIKKDELSYRAMCL